ncbi:MAG: nitroreductase family deazaflavin-dependent oxidoreductase [Anaerolineales bacterium]|nr:nitroreductase family deazaflavin-dependent oxidoreductase [Anaerolineales bacterium]
MVEKIRDVRPPRGLARLAFRLPIGLFRLGLGGLLGTRFLLLIHSGRKTGRERRTVLEVVRHDKEKSVFVVAAGFGPQSDWYQNLRSRPQAFVQSGRRRWNMRAEFLTPDRAGEEMLDYGRRHPAALRGLVGIMGYRVGENPEDIRAFGRLLSMVAFHPEDQPTDKPSPVRTA